MAANPVEIPYLPLKLEVNSVTDDITVVNCSGRLVREVSDIFIESIRELLPRSRRVVLDLTDLRHMDSSGLGAVVRLYVSAKASGRELKLINLSAQIQHLLHLTRLTSLFGAGAAWQRQ